MAFIQVNNVKIGGFSVCVPKQIDENISFPIFDKKSYENFVASTGIERYGRFLFWNKTCAGKC